ncbi:sensor domain-containing protein [Streptomyces pactum]|nr:sensor domain-containing protein [Streptomyces pactum]
MTDMTPPYLVSRAPSPYAGREGLSTSGPDARWDSGPLAERSGRTGRFGRELGYLLTGLPLGIAAFTVAVTGFVVGAATFVTVLGLPVLLGTLAAARAFARTERRRVEHVTGRPLPPHHYRQAPADTGIGGKLGRLREPQSWRDLVHMVVSFPVRIIGFCLAVTWTVGGLGELLNVTWSWAIPRDDGDQGLLDLMFDVESRAADIAFHTGIGLVLLATAVPVIRLLTAAQTGLARGLLTNPAAAHRTGGGW